MNRLSRLIRKADLERTILDVTAIHSDPHLVSEKSDAYFLGNNRYRFNIDGD